MKNCDEMVSSLLERRDRYAAEQKRKRKVIARAASSVCCVCLVALLGFGIFNGKSPDEPAASDMIVINSIDGVSSDKMNICLHTEDFVEMSRDEMISYYGVNYIPEVPSDINAWEDERSGIYMRNGGTGEVYWDVDILNYSNEDFTRNIHIEVTKARSIVRDYMYLNGAEEKSLISNVEVLLGKAENGFYYAEFTYNGVGFLLDAEGLTQDEFVAVITSLIK